MATLRKFVLITGCSAKGIGAVFHEKGYHVFATARTPSKVPPTLSSAANVTVLRLDVLSPDSIAAAVKSVSKETNGRLDVLINNSGGTLVLPALDVPIEEGKKIFDLNFWAPFAMLQAFAPLLIKAKGCIVNNASANAVCPMPLMSVYNSSKAALATASETWRHELQPLGVRTITVMTCGVKTKSIENFKVSFEVPETSHYFEIRDFIERLPDGRLQKGAISPRQYAIKMVQEVEKGAVGTVWAGTNAFWARVGVWLSPQSVLDKLLESIVPFHSEMAKAKKN